MKTRKCKVGGVDAMLTFLLGHSLDRWHGQCGASKLVPDTAE